MAKAECGSVNTHVGVWIASIPVIEPVEGHEGHLPGKSESVHGCQDTRPSLISVHNMME